MDSVWSLVAFSAGISVLLGLAILACSTPSYPATKTSTGRVWLIAAASTVPFLMIMLGVAFDRGVDRTIPAPPGNATATYVCVALGASELLVVALLIWAIVRTARRTFGFRHAVAILLACAYLPLTLLSLLAAGQMLAGVSL